jgi:hypothetical protein
MHLRYKKGVFMGYRNLPYTFQRNGNYYLQIRLSMAGYIRNPSSLTAIVKHLL